MADLLNVERAATLGSAPSGLVTIPMKLIDDGIGANAIEEDAAFVAGMFGYQIHEQGTDGRPSLEPMHGWSLLLKPGSEFDPKNRNSR